MDDTDDCNRNYENISPKPPIRKITTIDSLRRMTADTLLKLLPTDVINALCEIHKDKTIHPIVLGFKQLEDIIEGHFDFHIDESKLIDSYIDFVLQLDAEIDFMRALTTDVELDDFAMYIHSNNQARIQGHVLFKDDKKYNYTAHFQPSISLSKKILEYAHDVGLTKCLIIEHAARSDVLVINNDSDEISIVNSSTTFVHIHADCIDIRIIEY